MFLRFNPAQKNKFQVFQRRRGMHPIFTSGRCRISTPVMLVAVDANFNKSGPLMVAYRPFIMPVQQYVLKRSTSVFACDLSALIWTLPSIIPFNRSPIALGPCTIDPSNWQVIIIMFARLSKIKCIAPK